MKSTTGVAKTRNRDGRNLSEPAEGLFREGSDHMENGEYAEALCLLRQAADLAPDHAQLRSALGLAVAYAESDFEQSRALCESAAKQEFFNPDLYLNLSRVYLKFGRRSEALRYLRRGKMIDPGHVSIQRSIALLGQRKMPILPFLPRRHPVNRALGSARSFVMGPFLER